MDVGVGLPSAVRGVDRRGTVEWAPGRGGRLLVAVKRYLSGFEAVGVDEVICFPTSVDPDQVDLLAGAVR